MKLQAYNGRYCESDFENALVLMVEAQGWAYLGGEQIERNEGADVLIADDLRDFLAGQYPFLSTDEVKDVMNLLGLAGAESEFATLHKIYTMLVDGINYTTADGTPHKIRYIDFEHGGHNRFRVVNQFTVDYVNNGQRKNRRPDVLLYVNGIPLCIFELKNPGNDHATIFDAYEQITIRYRRDIPHLIHYCPLAVISDGVHTRLGTVWTQYEHFYAWRRVENEDRVSQNGADELDTMVRGVFAPERFLELFRDYIYFRDRLYDKDETEIVCRYPQFFASRLLRDSILQAVKTQCGKGGTYFGATGCGKTYTMMFLARQLSLRCGELLGSPTVVMIVDRDDLQNQGAKLFMKSAEYLSLGEVKVVQSRKALRDELSCRNSGGFYICTIQKFCDRKDDPIGEINARPNIICFSDEAHRTQIERSKQIKFEKDADENMKAMISKPYAAVLHEAFPHAVFVGFTGTPIAETYQTFGSEIDRYTMDQAVADGITVPIKYHPRIAKVLFDEEKVKLIEAYYRRCADEGAKPEDIAASKAAMSSMEIILDEPERLRNLALDIYRHFTSVTENEPDRPQKAMIVCANRNIAYHLLDKFREIAPDWFTERKSPDDSKLKKSELDVLKPMPTIAMVATVGKNDPEEMYNYLGGVTNHDRNKILDECFKQEKSNFRIVIVVDMWITGFDVPCLTYLYNDKPLQKHSLIQTISRVNRNAKGKTFGLIVDYIGIRDNMLEAMKTYGSDDTLEPSKDDVEQAYDIFREHLEILTRLFSGFDVMPFLNPDLDPVERYKLLSKAAEFVLINTECFATNGNSITSDGPTDGKNVDFKTYFLAFVRRMRLAYDVCQPSGILTEKENALAQCFMTIAGFVRKISGKTQHDTESMNRAVEKMVEEALKYNRVISILDKGEEEDLFDPKFTEILVDVPMPATRLELLIKMLRRQIKDYGRTNALAAKKYQELLEATIKDYHERRKHLTAEEAGQTQEETSEDIIANATRQALEILKAMNADRESFRSMGLTFEEKAFYDILIHLRDTYNFEYGTDDEHGNDKCKKLAKKIKEIIDTKSQFSDWLNNQRVRDTLKLEIKLCLIKNGYPPQYSPEVFKEIMGQVENFRENSTEDDYSGPFLPEEKIHSANDIRSYKPLVESYQPATAMAAGGTTSYKTNGNA